MDDFAWSGAVHCLPKRTRHLISRFRMYAMEALFDELDDVLLHAKPTAVFRQPLVDSHGTTMASILHVSTHHQPHLTLLSSARNPKYRTPINLETNEPLVIQGDLTIDCHKRHSPPAIVPRLARDARCASRVARLDARVPSLLVCVIHRGRTNTHRRNCHPPREKISPAITSPVMCMIV